MRERTSTGHLAKQAGLIGEAVNRNDLPEHVNIRWIRRRKGRVVAAVRAGILSLHEALERYSLSLEEFIEWERDMAAELNERRRTGRMRELTVLRGKTARAGRAH